MLDRGCGGLRRGRGLGIVGGAEGANLIRVKQCTTAYAFLLSALE